MASLEKRRWEGDPAGLTRRDRRPCTYEVYLPDRLASRRFVLDGDVAADVGDAEAALLKLDASAAALAGTEALARLLLRAESVASSRIEGLEVGGRRLLRADAARQLGEASRDITALEVLGNIDAMVWGVDTVGPGGPITLRTLLEAHRRLVAGTRLENHGGRLRTLQNWIGGSYNPCSAEFVPPPPESVADLLDDLLAFCADDALPALAQAAIAHAQFETIHPFFDGNGRMGRLLIILVLCEQGILGKPVLYLSHFFKMHRSHYYAALQAVRDDGDWEGWMEFFLAGVVQVAHESSETARRIVTLREEVCELLLHRLGRAAGNALRLHEQLFRTPIIDVSSAAQSLGITYSAANRLIGALVREGVVAERTGHTRNRRFAYQRYIDLFAD